jgi:hypothetical protein
VQAWQLPSAACTLLYPAENKKPVAQAAVMFAFGAWLRIWHLQVEQQQVCGGQQHLQLLSMVGSMMSKLRGISCCQLCHTAEFHAVCKVVG